MWYTCSQCAWLISMRSVQFDIGKTKKAAVMEKNKNNSIKFAQMINLIVISESQIKMLWLTLPVCWKTKRQASKRRVFVQWNTVSDQKSDFFWIYAIYGLQRPPHLGIQVGRLWAPAGRGQAGQRRAEEPQAAGACSSGPRLPWRQRRAGRV